MTSKIRLIACLLFLAFPLIANAGIVHNSGSLGADSLSIRLALLDTLGQPTQVDTTKDWGYLFVFYPGGDSCYSDSFLIAQSDAHIELWTSAVFTDAWFTYKEAVSALDNAGLNGVYTWHVQLRDSSLKLSTWYRGEFDLVTQGDFASILDSAARARNALDTLQVYDNAGQFQAEVAAIKAKTDLLSFSGISGGVDANVIDWNSEGLSLGSGGGNPNVNTASMGSNTITSSVIQDGAIGAAEIAADAITSSEIATTAADEIGFAANNMGDDSAAWISGADTSAMMHHRLGGQYANLDNMTGTIANSQVDDDVDVNTKTITDGAIAAADFAAGAIDDAAVADGAIDWGGELDTAGFGAGLATSGGVNVISISGSTAVADNLEEMLDNDSTVGPRIEIRGMAIDASANGGTNNNALAIKNKGGSPVVHIAGADGDSAHGLLISTGNRSTGQAGSAITLRPNTGGSGIWIHGDSGGTGLNVYSQNPTSQLFQPVYLESGSHSSANAVEIVGNGSGAGVSIGGGTGDAIEIFAGGNGDGIDITGSGSGHGINSTGGSTGHGMHLQGGSTSGSGLNLRRTGSATGMHDLALFNNDPDSGWTKGDTTIINQSLYNYLLDRSHNFNVQIVNAEWDSAGGVISDSVWAADTNNALWNSNAGKFGYWNASRQAATATIDCDGSGVVSCTLDVRNGSGGLGGVTVTVRNTSNAFLYQALSNANGFVYFNLDQSTTYRVLAGGLAGSVHDSLPYQTLVTTTATNIRDTVPMTTTAIGSPGAANLKRVYVYQYSGGKPVSGYALHAALKSGLDSTAVPFDTSTGVCYAYGVEVVDTGAVTNVNGYAHLDLPLNNYISPFGNRWLVWITKGNGNTVWGPYELNLTTTTSDCVQHIYNGGACP